MNRLTINITGESGSGLLSSGEILIKSFKSSGYFVHAERDYPSLIKGGKSCFQINISNEPIHSLKRECDVLIALDKTGLRHYINTVSDNGIVLHTYERNNNVKVINAEIENRNLKVNYLPGRETTESCGGTELMVNMVLLGMLWKILDLNLNILTEKVTNKFKAKPKLLEIDLKCLQAGYSNLKDPSTIKLPPQSSIANKSIVIDGNTSFGIGAINCGVRGYYVYPMSPSSGILTYLAKQAMKTDMLVKQAEDEMTAIQMTIGSMHMGTRALVATSGGGYDLMTESVSLAGMIETPLVCIIVQRPGPATGLPTWTAQADLNMSIFSSHGEFPKIVVSASDATSCFELVQHSFNLAEEYQVPVILLSEKTIAESFETVEKFDENKIPIKRNIVTNKKELDQLKSNERFKITESGLSKRWIPGSSKTVYFANGDEHWEDGVLTEDADKCKEMISKRMRKMILIEKNLPEPELFGPENADISFIGWGSSKNTMLDIIKESKLNINYLHYSYLWPLKTEKLIKFTEKNKNIHIIEGNYQGQLGELIKSKCPNLNIDKKLLKYDGRPFYMEDVLEYIEKITK